MAEDISNRLIVAISSQALFDLSASNNVFEQEGIKRYAQYQKERENELLEPGAAYNLVEKLLKLNLAQPCVEVILMSRNSSDTGLRIFNSIAARGLDITRAVFTSGRNPFNYAQAFGAHLFLSTNAADVCQALTAGMAAATLQAPAINNHPHPQEIRIAFDGDAVLFSDEAERVYQAQGLAAFHASEKDAASKPLADGPFKYFLQALHVIQQKFPEDSCPIRTALITARQAPAHERVIRTLRHWEIRIDESIFLGGVEKSSALKAFAPDIFFDDQWHHCELAQEHVPTAHVPHGIVNESLEKQSNSD